MADFTAAELANIAAQSLDYFYRGQPFSQSIQDKPLLREMEAARKSFPGGKGNISIPVRGDFVLTNGLQGFTNDDSINYDTIVGAKRASYPWREHTAGWKMSYTELKIDGITVVDSATGSPMRRHPERDLHVLSNILEDKLFTFNEALERQLNTLLWGTGSDPKQAFGLQYFLTTTPTTGTIGGIDRATDQWWRHRYGIVDVGSAPAAGAYTSILEGMQTEMRQLRRYGGRPNIALCSTNWLVQMEKELRDKGYYTQQGWSRASDTNFQIADPRWGTLVFEYDPTMDDVTALQNSCFLVDTSKLYIYAMADEYGKDHAPARPHDVYALFRSRTYTFQMVMQQGNAHGRYVLQSTSS